MTTTHSPGVTLNVSTAITGGNSRFDVLYWALTLRRSAIVEAISERHNDTEEVEQLIADESLLTELINDLVLGLLPPAQRPN